jgi:hypothetical protein
VGRDRADRDGLRHQHRAHHTDRQWNLEQRVPLLVLDDDAAHVPLVHDLLHAREQVLSVHFVLFGGHGFLRNVGVEA